MRGLIDKKGAAHFEMIMSFVFFVGFVLFLFMVLKPQDTSTLSGAVVAGLYDSFEEKVHTNLSSVFLKANYTDSGPGTCFNVTLPGRIFSYAIFDGDSSVTKVNGEKVGSGLFAPELNVNKTGDEFFRIAISPEFEDDGESHCDNLDDYSLGSIIERRVVSYSELENMTEDYREEYEDLRREMRVPPIFDFAIVAENLPIVMEPDYGTPDSVEVMAQDRIVEVLYPNGTVVNERFTLKIW